MARFSVMGDSISTFEGISPSDWRMFYDPEQQEKHGVLSSADTWWGQIIDHFGGELLRNGSFSGCCVEGPSFPAAESAERIGFLGTDEAAPDHVLVFIGINDYGWGTALYQAKCASPSAPKDWAAQVKPAEPFFPGTVDEEALELFSAGYERMVRGIKERWPEATVWCATLPTGRLTGVDHSTFTYRFRGNEFSDHNAAIARAAENGGGVLCDLAGYGLDYDALDGVHPTNLGMKQVAAMFISQMEASGKLAAEAPLDWAAAKAELFQGFEAQRLCEKDSCEGCEFASSYGFPWTTVCDKDL